MRQPLVDHRVISGFLYSGYKTIKTVLQGIRIEHMERCHLYSFHSVYDVMGCFVDKHGNREEYRNYDDACNKEFEESIQEPHSFKVLFIINIFFFI